MSIKKFKSTLRTSCLGGLLLVKGLLVLLPIILLSLYARSSLLAFVDSEAPNFLLNQRLCRTAHPQRYAGVVLGDSTANAAYMPELLGNILNLALGGTSPMENYYTLRDFLAHNPAPQRLYLSFIDQHLTGADYGAFWQRTIFTHRYSLRQTLQMLHAASQHDMPPKLETAGTSSVHRYLTYLQYLLYLPSNYIVAIKNAGFNQRLQRNQQIMTQMRLHGGRYIARTNRIYAGRAPHLFKEFMIKSLYDFYYRKILDLCRSTQIHTVRLVKLPLPNSQFTPRYREQLKRYYTRLIQDYPDLEISFDWFEDDFTPAYFADATHLNTHGAARFSRQLKAKYPTDFPQESQTHQQWAAAMQDNIRAENELDELFNWVNGRPYTLLLYDSTHNFEQYYYSVWQQANSDLQLLSTHPWAIPQAKDFYLLQGVGVGQEVGLSAITLTKEGHQLRVCINYAQSGTDGDHATLQFSWNPYAVHGISVVVIDQIQQQLVGIKNFVYQAAHFELH